ncbi:MAG: HD domain-containing protein [Coriobacteriaceae bacterium]|nr:HD domain-containing protein [Coriobacteriaceae bacterium]
MDDTAEFFEFTDEEKEILREQEAARQAALSPYACRDSEGIREYPARYTDPDVYLARPCFVVDVEKIVHNPFYSRCADKTQVFSFCHNDDITRRSFHLQVVSRIGRTIGASLGLNLDLIEAIAVGHDLGHTPFGHEGERMLSALYHERTGRYFNHNVHSVRLLRTIAHTNLCLQTYNGILTHCGEKTFLEYRPQPCDTFADLDKLLETCYVDESSIRDLRPSTLEGCVVRISDIIAYIGKDRQDAERVGAVGEDEYGPATIIGARNHEMIRNITRNIIKRSLGHDYLSMDAEVFDAINEVRDENYRVIYESDAVRGRIKPIEEMMGRLYMRLVEDIEQGRADSPVFIHHIDHKQMRHDYHAELADNPDDAVCDYIASMTDDYFVDLYRHLFGEDALLAQIRYRPYFD